VERFFMTKREWDAVQTPKGSSIMTSDSSTALLRMLLGGNVTLDDVIPAPGKTDRLSKAERAERDQVTTARQLIGGLMDEVRRLTAAQAAQSLDYTRVSRRLEPLELLYAFLPQMMELATQIAATSQMPIVGNFTVEHRDAPSISYVIGDGLRNRHVIRHTLLDAFIQQVEVEPDSQMCVRYTVSTLSGYDRLVETLRRFPWRSSSSVDQKPGNALDRSRGYRRAIATLAIGNASALMRERQHIDQLTVDR
jgi:hypothetical protein